LDSFFINSVVLEIGWCPNIPTLLGDKYQSHNC